MDIPLISATGLRGLPLCRSYVCVTVDLLFVKVDGETGVHTKRLHWAVGILSDGRADYLGSWHESDAAGAVWQSIANDLKAGGVERLRFVMGPDPVGLQVALAAHYREVTGLAALVKASGDASLDSVLPGHRGYLELARDVSSQLSRRLKRAGARHGSFTAPGAAAALLRRSAERYIRGNWRKSPEVLLRGISKSAAAAHH